MGFDKSRLPSALECYQREGLKTTGPTGGKWFTVNCVVHNGSDSKRVNSETGGCVCYGCGFKAGDFISYVMQVHGLDFVAAAKYAGAWVDDGAPAPTQKPLPLPARQALQALQFESLLVAVAAANVAKGVALTEEDKDRLIVAARRVRTIAETY